MNQSLSIAKIPLTSSRRPNQQQQQQLLICSPIRLHMSHRGSHRYRFSNDGGELLMIRVYSRLDGWLAQRLRAQCRPCLLRFLYLPSRSLPSLPSLESLASLASLQSLVSRLPSLESRLPSLLSRLPSRLLLSRPLPPSLLSRLLSLLSRPDPELHHTTPHIHTRLSNPRPPCDLSASPARNVLLLAAAVRAGTGARARA